MSSCSAFRRGWEIGASEEHAAACPGCAEWVAGQRGAHSALAHLAAAFDRTATPAERELALRVAFRQAQHPAPARRAAPWVWGLVAAAACVVIVVLALPRATTIGRERAAANSAAAQHAPRTDTPVRPVRRPVASAPARAARALPTAPTAPQAAETPAPSPGVVEQAVAEAASVVPQTTAVAEAPPALEAAAPAAPAGVSEPQAGAVAPAVVADERGFHPIPGAEAGDMESGQIVRVQLRPDVLDAAGLPPRAGNKGPVEAEVLVGPDGVARGIRLARPQR